MMERTSAATSTKMMLQSAGLGAAPWMARIEEHTAWPVLAQLPVLLTVHVSLKRFCVRDVFKLEIGQVIESDSSQTIDVPLAVGEVKLAWCEFEVSGQRIGVRLTQLA